MALLLRDVRLYEFIGGAPEDEAGLSDRYRRQVVGQSPDGSQRWFNWIIRRRGDARAVGTVQATVVHEGGRLLARLAWLVGTAYQGEGYARESAEAMACWLRQQGVASFVAYVHPDHGASGAVARGVGLAPTAATVDGEICWEG